MLGSLGDEYLDNYLLENQELPPIEEAIANSSSDSFDASD